LVTRKYDRFEPQHPKAVVGRLPELTSGRFVDANREGQG
jgi:hypothetical protein